MFSPLSTHQLFLSTCNLPPQPQVQRNHISYRANDATLP